jgi:hypothetical protein
MDTKNSLPYSHGPTAGTYVEPGESIPHAQCHIPSIHCNTVAACRPTFARSCIHVLRPKLCAHSAVTSACYMFCQSMA